MSNTPANEKTLSQAELDQIIRQHDSESNFRSLIGFSAGIVTFLAVGLSLFHIYTAGFGLLNEIAHRTIHLAFVMGLIFLVFPPKNIESTPKAWRDALFFGGFYAYMVADLYTSLDDKSNTLWFLALSTFLIILTLPIKRFMGTDKKVAWKDWIFGIAGAGFSLYLVINFDHVFIENVGDPGSIEYMLGVIAIIMVLEATRRTMGPVLAVIGVICLLYALLGSYLPGPLAHRGYNILRIVKHMYIGTEGIYGIAVGVVATYVFHFVLFGILAQASGLGQLFIDLASIIAGRQVGGSAKVSVVSSGFFGMISGSPIANTVTTGSFTIPLMKKSGFSGRFSAAVEASASCGGQVTPPIMGASAFVMTELLGVPYNEIILIAIIPAAFHYLAIFLMVHLEAKRLGLKGMSDDKIPKFKAILSRQWHLFIPLTIMVTLLVMQYTPFLAAFWGIILTVVCSYIPLLVNRVSQSKMDTQGVLYPKKLLGGLEGGAKYALAIGAACACVGFILGVTTLTGLGFKFSATVVDFANDIAIWIKHYDVLNFFTVSGLSLFFGLVFVAIACIIMGAGIPTTPTYIILASIAAPALSDLGVPLIATHFFVFYFGVLADVTPPVALAAYAGAGIAGSDPMRTGFTAFRLSMGKALVPFMFVYAPSLLLTNFNIVEFIVALISGIICITALSAAYIGYFKSAISRLGKISLTIGALFLIGNQWIALLIGLTLVGIVLIPNYLKPVTPDKKHALY